MQLGRKLGNTTDYFTTPCPHTVSYYTRQINAALKQAFRDNPRWMKPETRAEVVLIIEDIQEWYHPFSFTQLKSVMFNALWSQALRELRVLLEREIRGKEGCAVKTGLRSGKYDQKKLHEILETLKTEGMTIQVIASLAEMKVGTIYRIINGKVAYRKRVVTKHVEKLIRFLETIEIDTCGLIEYPGKNFFGVQGTKNYK